MNTSPLNFSFFPSEGVFRISVKSAAKVSYTITYSHVRDGQTIQEAILGGGKADTLGLFSARHLAGTESNNAKVIHAVKSGELNLVSTDSAGLTSQYRKVFTISEKGVVETRDAAPGVLGASTESGVLSKPIAPLVTKDASQLKSTMASPTITPVDNSKDENNNVAGLGLVSLGVGLMLLVVILTAVLMKKAK
jgi:hypothetical protein